VPEVSRAYLNQRIARDNTFRYSEPDLLAIAQDQHKAEQRALDRAPTLLICDTDLLVIIIWSEVRFGHCHPWIVETFADSIDRLQRHYLLCDFNVPWQPDPLRESADSRPELFALYLQKLEYFGLDYSISAGAVEERLSAALALVGNRLTAQ
jgi:nicotinamide riboside kinase